MFYPFLKDTHSILRWVVLLTALWALARVWAGLLKHSAWSKKDRIAGLAFSSSLNLQFVIGIVLYGISPLTKAAMTNFGAAMKDGMLRFYAVEHPTMMFLAVVLAQVGFSLSKRHGDDRGKFVRAAIFYTIAFVLVLAAIPWPFSKYARPLLPGFGG